MTDLERTLSTIASALRQRHSAFALVGGLAVSLRTEPRFTRDADLAVSVSSDVEAEALIASLRSDRFDMVAAVEQMATGRLATVRLQHGDSPMIVDLLFASSGIEPEIAAAAEELMVLPGLRLRVATVAHLIVMKLLSRDDDRRPNDRADLLALAQLASERDWLEAAEAADLVTKRGYARGRDLAASMLALRQLVG
jgi:Nucleotidyl transferase AbiEii toxin, Type IV TA system